MKIQLQMLKCLILLRLVDGKDKSYYNKTEIDT